MMNLKNSFSLGLIFISVVLSACAPEVGSKAWCDAMDKKPKGDWSVNEAGEYAKSCVFRQQD